jgi:hypothetical protein
MCLASSVIPAEAGIHKRLFSEEICGLFSGEMHCSQTHLIGKAGIKYPEPSKNSLSPRGRGLG